MTAGYFYSIGYTVDRLQLVQTKESNFHVFQRIISR